MIKKLMMTLIITLFVISPCLAISYRPMIEVSNGMTLTQSLKQESSMKVRSSYFVKATAFPIGLSFKGGYFAPYASLILNSDSIIQGNLKLLGYKALEVGFFGEIQVNKLYSLSLSFGSGYGELEKSETGFAHLGLALENRFALHELATVSLLYSLNYRIGYLEHRIGVGATFTPWKGDKR